MNRSNLIYRVDESLQSESDILIDGHLDRIRFVSGRDAVTEDDIYVRSMWLASTQHVASDGMRFSREALEQVARLSVGKSVIVGHDKTSAPIARIYHAIVTERSGYAEPWVRAWFYWPRSINTVNGINIRDAIDYRVWKGVSLSFRIAAVTDVIKGLIKRISDVLEASVVFEPADKGAEFAPARSESDNTLEETERLKMEVENLQRQVADLRLELATKELEAVANNATGDQNNE